MQLSARSAALSALERCRRQGQWSGAAIDDVIKKYSLDRRDAAFASALCLGVLQNSSLCDYYIGLFCTTRPEKLEPKLRDILRLGVYQLIFMSRVPERAAVNETVELCRACSLSRASGLVNAVLRKIADRRDNLPEPEGKGSAEYLSVRYSHPIWLCRRLVKDYGYDFAEGFLRCSNTVPQLDIQINTLRTDLNTYCALLDEAGVEYTVNGLPKGSITVHGGNVIQLPGFNEGLFYVQDRAARLAASLAGAKAGMHILDCCAAPGGKSVAMALDMHDMGSITSCDISEKKLKLIDENAKRLGITIIQSRQANAFEYAAEMDSKFDLVMADVPCSGLGVIAKKPEIRNKSPEEISGLPKIQLAIINNVSNYVKPGGTLLYSTCTVLKEENEDIVNTFLASRDDFELDTSAHDDMPFSGGMHVFWPHIDGTDGFFAARLIRKQI